MWTDLQSYVDRFAVLWIKKLTCPQNCDNILNCHNNLYVDRFAAMGNELIARKSNYLIESSYKLTLAELRVTYLGVSKLFTPKPLSLQRTQRIYAKEYAKVFGVDKTVAYRQVADASDSLLRRVVTTRFNHDGTPFGKGKYMKHQWLEKAKYSDNEGYVDITFHECMSQYLTVLGKRYAELNFECLKGVQSVYAVRLWELLIQYRKDGERFIMLDDFRMWFKLEKKYPMYADLRKRVIEPAINELEEKADLDITWDVIKKGRKVIGFDFMFEESQQVDMFKLKSPG